MSETIKLSACPKCHASIASQAPGRLCPSASCVRRPLRPKAVAHPDAAHQLGITEGAVKVVVHRLRKQFRETVRTEIAQTLRDPANVDEELRHLVAALS